MPQVCLIVLKTLRTFEAVQAGVPQGDVEDLQKSHKNLTRLTFQWTAASQQTLHGFIKRSCFYFPLFIWPSVPYIAPGKRKSLRIFVGRGKRTSRMTALDCGRYPETPPPLPLPSDGRNHLMLQIFLFLLFFYVWKVSKHVGSGACLLSLCVRPAGHLCLCFFVCLPLPLILDISIYLSICILSLYLPICVLSIDLYI